MDTSPFQGWTPLVLEDVGQMLFRATDGERVLQPGRWDTHGSELWRVPLPDLAAPTLTCPGAMLAHALGKTLVAVTAKDETGKTASLGALPQLAWVALRRPSARRS
ncbi:hypothetical protein [Archangium sp.]|uniref:hypothetical protein n=1 Tax=Archangium sp. TaxID=1872627 RepID=UPI002D6B09B4|nr:hypothetical protein [Archangium sp.]HYO52184.1 hypothetical protein [Archangium sp.]